MNIRFETCERRRALEYLQVFYPSRNLKDEGKTKALLDLVEADIIRIPDPKYHPSGQVYPNKNWDKTKANEYLKILEEFDNGMG
jgi:hypothetical protein